MRKNSDVVLLGGVLLLTRKRINRSLESLNRNNPDSPSECNETAQTSLRGFHIGGAAIKLEPLTKLREGIGERKQVVL